MRKLLVIGLLFVTVALNADTFFDENKQKWDDDVENMPRWAMNKFERNDYVVARIPENDSWRISPTVRDHLWRVWDRNWKYYIDYACAWTDRGNHVEMYVIMRLSLWRYTIYK